jgi:hypothetical protein
MSLRRYEQAMLIGVRQLVVPDIADPVGIAIFVSIVGAVASWVSPTCVCV